MKSEVSCDAMYKLSRPRVAKTGTHAHLQAQFDFIWSEAMSSGASEV